MFELDLSNLEESLKQCKEDLHRRKRKMLAVMQPFLTTELDSKKQTELAHIAQLAVVLDCKIVKMMESPDFIISQDERVIGLEIRQLNTARAEYIGYIQNLFQIACRAYMDRFPDHKMLVNFWTSKDFIYKGREKESLIDQIVAFTHDCAEGLRTDRPNFIDRIDIQPYSSVAFHFNEGAYAQESITASAILSAIQEKERKIDEYIKHSGTSSQWLLLVNKELGSDSFDTYDFEGIGNVETRFERIFLLKDFDSEIIEIH